MLLPACSSNTAKNSFFESLPVSQKDLNEYDTRILLPFYISGQYGSVVDAQALMENNTYFGETDGCRYAVLRFTDPDKYLFLQFYHEEEASSVSAYAVKQSIYTGAFFDQQRFAAIEEGSSTLADVKAIDPDLMMTDYMGDSTFHWLNSGECLCIRYDENGVVTQMETYDDSISFFDTLKNADDFDITQLCQQ